MFGFETLEIYKRAKALNLEIRSLLKSTKLDFATENQLRRAALSVQLNLAEGNGRFSRKDIRHFYIMSRSSIHECVAILDLIKEENYISQDAFSNIKRESEEVSKILFHMIKKLSD